ncbi:restriction endonuclease [Gottfriedia solisilvae]|uniref:Restriction endonuclease type IV Mrr domain-containing protein n=1 Tax=Gottfriedia solisilvae TaxID=1516104 RepID=A0A8J3ATL4_9BACI|nr:restriction endonuclease [Gottfriedia solisilvae]GGI16592.1 hypothetical protein GCM10007380_33730 [Gottfriedia solisilvae]
MARRRSKKQEKAIDELLSYLTIGIGVYIYYLTNSISTSVLITSLLFICLIAFMFIKKSIRNERLRQSGINEIDKMDGVAFEKYLKELFVKMGYSVKLTSVTGDYGADLILEKNNKKIVVQAKRYSKSVGIKAVQEVKSAMSHYKAREAWVVSNSFYTQAAINLAKSNNVRLIDRKELIEQSLAIKNASKNK